MKKQIGLVVLVLVALVSSSLFIGFVNAEQKWKTYENKE
jgi:hypothetical protein